jgi:tripartite-type tricarboxylate transporter receptor subunit TctC
MEYFSSIAGLKMIPVDYKGAAPATIDVVAGHVPLQFDNILTLYPLTKQGKLRAMAVSTPQRSPIAPEVPTMAEAGVPGYSADAWFGLVAPAATPKDIITRLNSEVMNTLQNKDMIARLHSFGDTPGSGSPEEFNALFPREIAKWAKVIKSAGVQLN